MFFTPAQIRAFLIPFLLVLAALLAALLGFLIAQRAAREVAFRRRQRLLRRYRPLVDTLFSPQMPPDAFDQLARVHRGHRSVVGHLLLAPLRVADGTVVAQARRAGATIGLTTRWFRDLSNRRWWVRADGARALGLVREPAAFNRLVALLDDEHEEVRAAAVEALGRLADERAIPELLSRLPDQSRHQRARIVEALQAFGASVTPPVMAYVKDRPQDAEMVADLLGIIGASNATHELLGWCGDSRPEVRAAAMRSLGTLGLDDRTYYYALRGLVDENPEVRAMAARALGRSGRHEAAPYLAGRLADEWVVAAHSARALRALGPPGLKELEGRADAEGQAGDLARQMLWERQALAVGA